MDIIIRLFVGDLVVCAFAAIAEMLRPRSFAGIFGAAPSVALATLGLTFAAHGGSYAGLEGRSIVIGALALLAYSLLAGWLLLRRRLNSFVAMGVSGAAWFAVAFGLWGGILQ